MHLTKNQKEAQIFDARDYRFVTSKKVLDGHLQSYRILLETARYTKDRSIGRSNNTIHGSCFIHTLAVWCWLSHEHDPSRGQIRDDATKRPTPQAAVANQPGGGALQAIIGACKVTKIV